MSLGWFSNYTDCIIKFNDLTTDLDQLSRNSFQMLRDHIFHHDISSGSSCCTHKGTCFDLVRDNGILSSMQLTYAADTDGICTCALDISSHTVKHIGNIYYMRLLSRILNYCLSFCPNCCKHNINCCSNRRCVKKDMVSN